MKQTLYLILTCCFLACGSSEKITEDWIVGSWKITKLTLEVPEHLKESAKQAEEFSKKITYTFNADSTFQLDVMDDETNYGKWAIEHDTILAMYYDAIDNKQKVEKRNTSRVDATTMRWLDNKRDDIEMSFELTKQ